MGLSSFSYLFSYVADGGLFYKCLIEDNCFHEFFCPHVGKACLVQYTSVLFFLSEENFIAVGTS